MKTTIMVTLFIAVASRVMADEVKAWFGWFHTRVRKEAVSRLPEEYRERYDKEWESGVEETPGEIFKLIYSIGLLRAGVGIRRAALKGVEGSEIRFAPLKRLLDIAFSGMFLIVFSPVLLAIAIAVKLDSHGPVFYSSERIGKKGRVFRVTKFRTMVRGAEKRRANVMHMNERDGVLFKISNDPRITKLGRFLRKYSLDELPQFLNVLRGDMSIVGPRPPIGSEVREYKLNQLRRLDVTPGITGLWQVQSRQDPFLSGSEPLDDIYVDNLSLWLYIKILARTIWVVFRGTGS